MADREKKRENGNTKMWISRERKELFRWNKKHFSKFLKDYHLMKKKKKKIAHTSFQTKQNQTYTTSSTRKLSILVT